MKVAILKGHLRFSGGLEKMTLSLAKQFAKKGCTISLLTTGEIPEISFAHPISFGKKSLATYRHLTHFDKACADWLQKNPHSIVFGMERNSFQTHYRAGSGVHAAYLQQRRLCDSFFKRISFKINPLHRKILSLEKQCFTHPELEILFTNSEMVKREVIDHYNISSQKIEVIHNGAPFEEWKDPFEESFKEQKRDFHFLFVGNGFRRKGLHFLLHGLSLLPRSCRKLLIVGKDKEQSYFQLLAKKLQIDATFFGRQQEMIPFYQQSDCLVIPSIYDPFAGVTTEALAMGLFVVSSRHNGGHEILNEENGKVIENLFDPSSIAECLKEALLRPKTKSRAECIRASIEHLDFSKQLDKIVLKTLKDK